MVGRCVYTCLYARELENYDGGMNTHTEKALY